MSAVGEARDRIGELIIDSINSAGASPNLEKMAKEMVAEGQRAARGHRRVRSSRAHPRPGSRSGRRVRTSATRRRPSVDRARPRETGLQMTGFVERNFCASCFPLPAIVFVVVMMLFPVVYTLFLSFTNWNLTSGTPLAFVGLAATRGSSASRGSCSARRGPSCSPFFAVGVESVLGVGRGALLNRPFVGKSLAEAAPAPAARGRRRWPSASSGTSSTIRPSGWPTTSLKLLRPAAGHVGLDARTVIPSLVLVDVWQWTPMITLIVLAGLAGLSRGAVRIRPRRRRERGADPLARHPSHGPADDPHRA